MKHYVLAVLLSVLPGASFADPQEDADYIVSQTVTRDLFSAALQAQRPLIIGAFQNELRGQGITLNNPDAFFDIFMEEWIDTFTDGMRDETAGLYLARFSEQELADIAEFLRSTSGQAYIRETPGLMQDGAALGMQVGQRAGVEVGPRLAERLRSGDVLSVEDQGLMDRLIDALR